MKDSRSTHTLIVGASAAGLAVVACLRHKHVDFLLLEQTSHVAASWRKHYDRLHLHTSRGLSNLPYYSMPRHYPRYPSRDQVMSYLEAYAAQQQIQPLFGQQVLRIEQQDGSWLTRTAAVQYRSQHVVVATGYARKPNIPSLKGQQLFQGTIRHSSEYKNGQTYAGQSVLVVGFGNSGGEIAIDLYEHGAQPSLAVRSPVNIIPRDVLGVPVLGLGIFMKRLPPAFADLLSAPFIRLTVGDIRRLGLRTRPYGPNQQIRRDKRIPLLDIGTVDLIRQGKISIYPGIDRLSEDGMRFVDGRSIHCDAIILATGY